MTDKEQDKDFESDELIGIIADSSRSSVERSRASQQLYERHTHWVVQQIGRKIYNPEDVQDIAQTVWMMVLQPEKLGRDYINRTGKFRAYLRAPIRWAILKHIDKLPFSLNEAGEKEVAHFADISETAFEEHLDQSMVDEVIENIIKPNLKAVDIKSRNVYVANEHGVIFDDDPTLKEVAMINGINDADANRLYSDAKDKPTNICTDEEVSVYLPVEYTSLIDPVKLSKSSGSYLSNLIGVSESAFRKRLHGARKQLLQIVQQSLSPVSGGINHG